MDPKIEQLTKDLATAEAKLSASERQYGAANEHVQKFSKEVEDLKTRVAALTKRAESAEGRKHERPRPPHHPRRAHQAHE